MERTDPPILLRYSLNACRMQMVSPAYAILLLGNYLLFIHRSQKVGADVLQENAQSLSEATLDPSKKSWRKTSYGTEKNVSDKATKLIIH